MHMNADQTLLVLASASPRRRELLSQLDLRFTVLAADIDETPRAGEAAEAYVGRLAREKARVVASRHPGAWVLAADTTVALGAELLGKPRDAEEAQAMLTRLSGRTHDVYTGVALAGRHEETLVVRTRVTFRALSAGELSWYAHSGEPLDKAGAYAIQGRGGFLVASVEGSTSNVVGLPLGETVALLERAGVPLPWRAS
ncbi:septum formation inhibitor Maf [Myxococcus sp. AM009]|uniref:Maf family protein n=1 Tax=unclassified Myxococcus TaxID=2648731 RepID=UPI0015955286|nr:MULTISPECIES: Maf family protein [unclassified Myxococcus]NVI97883.1 septum formation inhibitor Maf [Myxococcus sp. AM009]NVJ12979.1 septum formation inhibitor Maf [Myxococcus sp. AM010]